jgi:AbrB family looped-hinge helix DNA binding protein
MIKTDENRRSDWNLWSPGAIFLTGGKEMATATLTSKGQITLPKEVREHLHVSEGDRVDFIIRADGEVHVRPVTGSVRELFGCVHRPGIQAPTIEEMEQAMLDEVAKDHQRIREGRE